METQPGSDAEKYSLMYPMQYVKLWCGQSTAEGIFVDLQLAAIRAAGGLELLGIALQLLRMAACRDRFGGRLVDHLGHVASLREIALDFGQPMVWKDECKAWIYLDGVAAPISSGKVSGNVITLQLTSPSATKSIAYLSGKHWDGRHDKLLCGANGIAALAFSAVTIEISTP
jgi:hypothetical protein